jgi:hypothetical protein
LFSNTVYGQAGWLGSKLLLGMLQIRLVYKLGRIVLILKQGHNEINHIVLTTRGGRTRVVSENINVVEIYNRKHWATKKMASKVRFFAKCE